MRCRHPVNDREAAPGMLFFFSETASLPVDANRTWKLGFYAQSFRTKNGI
jgi:hypothetical protein